MSRFFSRALFLIFGLALQQLAHHLLERWYLGLLLKDFKRYGLGLTWENWFWIHHFLSAVLLVAGLWLGYWWGRRGTFFFEVRNANLRHLL